MRRYVVLVVGPRPGLRGMVGDWMEGAGFQVLTCPGPTGPDYSCAGFDDEACPLADEADVVLLDLALESDLVMRGPTSGDLLAYYTANGKPIVALAHGAADSRAFLYGNVRTVHWPSGQVEVVRAVRERLGILRFAKGA